MGSKVPPKRPILMGVQSICSVDRLKGFRSEVRQNLTDYNITAGVRRIDLRALFELKPLKLKTEEGWMRFLQRSRHSRICPSPNTTNLVVVNSSNPMGPKA